MGLWGVCELSVCCTEISVFKFLSMFADNKTPEELHETLVNKMRLVLSSGSDEECAVCLESLALPVITRCAHVFCKPCIFEVIRREQVGCSMVTVGCNSCSKSNELVSPEGHLAIVLLNREW